MAAQNDEIHMSEGLLLTTETTAKTLTPETPSEEHVKQDQKLLSSPVQHIPAVLDNSDDKTIDDIQCFVEDRPFATNVTISPIINDERTEYFPNQGTEELALTTQSMAISSHSHVSTSTSSMSLPIKDNDDQDDRPISSQTNGSKRSQTPSSTTPQPTISVNNSQQTSSLSKSGILTTEERIIYDQLVDAVREKDTVKVCFIHTAVCRVDPNRWERYVNQMTETEQRFLNDHIQQKAMHHETMLLDRSIHLRFGEATNENHICKDDNTITTPLLLCEKQTSPFPYCEKRSYSSGVVPILDYSAIRQETRSLTDKSKAINPGTYRLESQEQQKSSEKHVDLKSELIQAEQLLRLERQKSLQLECEITKHQQEVERIRQGYQQRNSISNNISGNYKTDHSKLPSSLGVSHGKSSVSSTVGVSDHRPSHEEDELWHENRRLKLELENMQRATEKRERVLCETQSFVSELRAEVLRLSNDVHIRRLHSASAHKLREEDSDRSLLYEVLRDYKQLSRDYDALQGEVEEAWDQVSEAERATREAEERASKLDRELILLMEKNELLRRSIKKRIDSAGAGKKSLERSSQSPQRSASAFGNVKQKRPTERSQIKDDPQRQGNLSKSMSDLRNSLKTVQSSHQTIKSQQVTKESIPDENLDHVCKRYDELQWQKREIETALSHIPATYSLPRIGATKRHTMLQKQEYLEKKLDRIDKELGSLRLKLRQANMLPSK